MTARLPVSHYDLYRIEDPAELDELGLDEALADRGCADRMAGKGRRPPAGRRAQDRIADDGPAMRAKRMLRGPRAGRPQLSETTCPCRLIAAKPSAHFCKQAGWGAAALTPAAGRCLDAALSARRTGRPHRHADGPAAGRRDTALPARCERRTNAAALGYNAIARLAGADCARFVAVADYLRARGLSAPEIYAADPARASS